MAWGIAAFVVYCCLTNILTPHCLCLTITTVPRPIKPAKDRQSEIVGVRLTPSERKAFDKAAKKAGLSLSNYIRKKLGVKP